MRDARLGEVRVRSVIHPTRWVFCDLHDSRGVLSLPQHQEMLPSPSLQSSTAGATSHARQQIDLFGLPR